MNQETEPTHQEPNIRPADWTAHTSTECFNRKVGENTKCHEKKMKTVGNTVLAQNVSLDLPLQKKI